MTRRPLLLECCTPVAHAAAGDVIDLAPAIPAHASRLCLAQMIVVRGNDGASRGAVVSAIGADGTCRATVGPALSRQEMAALGVVWSAQQQRLARTRLVVCP